jgi:2-iminobutanoate/2-iminopropanoate deaminase
MEKRQVSPDSVPQPRGPYSTAIQAGGFLFLSGQGPFDAQGGRVGESFEEQLRATVSNVEEILRAAGGTLDDVVQLNAYLEDIADRDTLNAVLSEHFTGLPPARTTVQVHLNGFDVELDCVAWLAK